jgi:predicted amidohydrolase
MAQASHDLARLRRNGLIIRRAYANAYHLTRDGLRFAIFYTKIHDRVLTPLFAVGQPRRHHLSATPCTPSTSTSTTSSTRAARGSLRTQLNRRSRRPEGSPGGRAQARQPRRDCGQGWPDARYLRLAHSGWREKVSHVQAWHGITSVCADPRVKMREDHLSTSYTASPNILSTAVSAPRAAGAPASPTESVLLDGWISACNQATVRVVPGEGGCSMARIALAQVDVALGDVAANIAHAHDMVNDAATQGADLVMFPELALHGYALGQAGGDRSLRADDARLASLAESGADVLVGFHEDGGVRRYNSAAYLAPDGVRHVHRKLYLPNYLAWEERKHASPGQFLRAFDTRIGRMGTLICNDAWQPVLPWLVTQDGAEVLLVPANSAAGLGPELLDVIDYWRDLLRFIARMQQCWVIFCNRVGTEAGARFWGGSRVLDPGGHVVAEAPLWEPDLVVADIDVPVVHRRRHELPLIAEARLGLIGRELARLIDEGGDA